jgi:putative SOS response-associated peptidase YedK
MRDLRGVGFGHVAVEHPLDCLGRQLLQGLLRRQPLDQPLVRVLIGQLAEIEGAQLGDVDARLQRVGVPTQIPSKRDPAVKLTKYVTNVRNFSSSFWRSMLTTPARRCLVPVTSFSEYGIAPGEDGKKPLHWFDVPSRPIFAFAGIWRPTERGNAYGFLTTEPNALVAPIHPKAMPVILHDDDYDRWLDDEWEAVKGIVASYPSQLMKVQ